MKVEDKYSDNFSDFLAEYSKDAQYKPIVENLHNVSNEINKLKDIQGHQDEQSCFIKPIEILNDNNLDPLEKTFGSIRVLNDIFKNTDIETFKDVNTSAAYKNIIHNYIEIAEHTSDANIAQQTIELANTFQF